MFVGIYFCNLKDFAKLNPSQTLMNLQYGLKKKVVLKWKKKYLYSNKSATDGSGLMVGCLN